MAQVTGWMANGINALRYQIASPHKSLDIMLNQYQNLLVTRIARQKNALIEIGKEITKLGEKIKDPNTQPIEGRALSERKLGLESIQKQLENTCNNLKYDDKDYNEAEKTKKKIFDAVADDIGYQENLLLSPSFKQETKEHHSALSILAAIERADSAGAVAQSILKKAEETPMPEYAARCQRLLHTEKNKKDFLDTCERSIGKELGQKVLNTHAELLSLADKMVNKTTKDFYQGDYQKKLEEMDGLLAQVAIQTQSQLNTYNFSLKNQSEADYSKKANAVFDALQSMDAAVQAELHTHFWQASRTVENDTLISGFRQTRPPIYNVMSDKINITAETLTTTYGNIVSWKLKDPHNPGSELEKECQRDTKGNPLQLSVRELEQAVAAVNLDRLKNKQESIQIKFHNKGRRFTIDCLDQGTKKSLLDGMKAIQDKRVAEKEEKQAASVTTKNVTPTLSAGQGGSGTATSPRLSSV